MVLLSLAGLREEEGSHEDEHLSSINLMALCGVRNVHAHPV